MNVAQEIERIAQAKVDLRKAITAKGVTVADTDRIDTYANKVAQIEGGGSGEGFGKYRVRFFDYDGTVLKTVYTDGGEVTAPAVPEHDRLLFQEWNNDFDNVTADLDVGAIYTTKSGKCEFDVWINDLGMYTGETNDATKSVRTLYMGIRLISGTVTVEWGDGETETLSTIGDTRLTHTYAESRKYLMMVSGDGEWTFPYCAFSANGFASAGKQDTYVTAARLTGIVKPQQEGAFTMLHCCETVTLSRELTDLNNSAFQNVPALVHLNFPRNFVFRYRLAQGCFRMKHAVISDTIVPGGWGSDVFDQCGLEDVVLPSSITEIPKNMFRDVSTYNRLTEVTVPPNVVKIDDQAFYALNVTYSLRKVTMKPHTPPSIQVKPGRNSGGSFASDGSLKEIIVPAGCGEAYKSATNWSYYADIIKEEEI